MGPSGHGQIAKALNNCLYNISCAAVGEILPLAMKVRWPNVA
jgi:3-hydroxyisobutyrate dehydrogenase-like beta-hydroxyacid dehydrogenase